MLKLILSLACLAYISAAYSNIDPIINIRRQGFDQDPKTFSHEVIAPWMRSFKPGYCDSWEWHTEARYKEQRLKICKELSGQRKHECDSANGYCRDKCPFTNGSYPFWRIRNADNVPFLWTVRTLQMFDSPNARYPLHNDPTKGYASTFFGPGYYASNAFDNNPDSIWVSNGVSSPGLNWIAYEFSSPVKINSVRITGEADHQDRTPGMWYVEASCEKYFKTYSTQWIIENHDHQTDKRWNRPRQQRWR
ncbi:uncharacterized protein LOC130647385 [Hydractinia symbiolongicarpus]|uniref:uncharacterized protein LOC130647385 n=1 Tax=Hydractinia symbiolongicarpus TaxID=13093 RepID=UPI00255127DF|nr:uncharacterized protein LOC130647385 [Hydractinia symbiolongicarpus]